ncbi:MAG: acylase [Bryobacteraceae bacterium]
MRNSRFALKLVATSVFIASAVFGAGTAETSRWAAHARDVTIIRDDWGIAHVYGKTDPDAVFGMIYAQAEDDFNRVETNYLNALGRLAEVEGESKVYQDLRMKLFIDPDDLQNEYLASPEWLQKLMVAFADGLNFYLAKHPELKPRVIAHFEPWMALSFSEGSIGGDIERVKLDELEAFYGKTSLKQVAMADEPRPAEPSGSNGIAIAPSNTVNHHALLLINPHTSFFFRSELQMVSNEGLNAYGAATWGQFFLYQGFNDRAGWMHTSSGVDAIDEYAETVSKRSDGVYAKYGNGARPLTVKNITVPYKSPSGMARKKFTTYFSSHGPIVRMQGNKWISIRLMQEHIKALTQSYTRTKARDYKSYRETMELKANSSNNTIFADADGDIAYFHGNYIPRRDTKFDWTKVVDGSNPATDWQGLLTVDETPHLLNPRSGWLYNCNNWPWSAAGPDSPRRTDYPRYVENGTESSRGLHAIRVLENRKNFTLESLVSAAYDSYLPWFDKSLPALLESWNEAPASHPLRAKLAEPIAALRSWNRGWAVDSVATSLAVFWGEEIWRERLGTSRRGDLSLADYVLTKSSPEHLLDSLGKACDRLTSDFGTWKIPWGEINRYQRLTAEIAQPFNDSKPSIAVGFTSSRWGSLAAFEARPYPGTKKWYGTSGNSFVAVVEFGDKVRAKAITAGGESGFPGSPHFNDEAQRYSTGNLRDVYFYRDQLKGHTEREYHPGS